MDIFTVFIIVIGILIFFLAWTVIKKLFKWSIIVGIVLVILILVTNGGINDFTSLKQRMDNPTIVLLEENEIITGFITGEEYYILSGEEFEAIKSKYSKDELDDIKGDKYKLIIIRTSIFEDFNDIKINNKDVTKEELLDFFNYNREISQIVYEDLELEVETNLDELKPALFAYLYHEEFKMGKNPIVFFSNYKRGHILIHPETMFFKITKILPLSWIDAKINKLQESGKDKIAENI